jgi:hypothetical protein
MQPSQKCIDIPFPYQQTFLQIVKGDDAIFAEHQIISTEKAIRGFNQGLLQGLRRRKIHCINK